jgi:PAS domain S-box-containing protein
VWADYTIAEDVGYWVKMFISVAEASLMCIVIADATLLGMPMFYVNDEFCKTTEYSKDEAQGRNCRFLQGPETEPESVEVIRETLRQGIDCHVKITNYKKSGSKFLNLLSMRPVHDSNGVYRFVIAVQFEVMNNDESERRLKTVEHLLRLLPTTLEVAKLQGMGTKVVDEQKMEGKAAGNMAARLEQALGGAKMKTIDAVNQAAGGQAESLATLSHRERWAGRASRMPPRGDRSDTSSERPAALPGVPALLERGQKRPS